MNSLLSIPLVININVGWPAERNERTMLRQLYESDKMAGGVLSISSDYSLLIADKWHYNSLPSPRTHTHPPHTPLSLIQRSLSAV